MKIKSIYSTERSVEQVMNEISKQYKEAFGDDQARLVIFFASSNFDPNAVISGLKEVFGDADIVGCTTAGELVSGRMLKNSIVAMVFDGEAVNKSAVEVVENLKNGNSVDEAFKRFETSFGPLKGGDLKKEVGIILIDGLSCAEERTMERIGDLTDITFIGGSAGDDGRFEKTFVFANGKTYTDAAVLLLLDLENGFDVIKTQSFKDSGKRLVASAVDEASREIIEFDGKPSAEAYAESLDTTIDKVESEFMSHPVGLVIGNDIFVRSPQRLIGNRMKFYCNVKQGANLAILDSTNIIEETARAVQDKVSEHGHVSAIMNFHCTLRTQELERKNQSDDYGKIFSDIPMVGFSTYGEEYIGHVNQTSTILLFK
jgi:hypothetical protein